MLFFFFFFKEGSRFNGLESCFNGFLVFPSFSFAQNARLIFIEKTFFFFFPNRLFVEMFNNPLRKNSTLVILRGHADLQLHPPSAAVDPRLA